MASFSALAEDDGETLLVEGERDGSVDLSETSASLTVIQIDERLSSAEDLASLLDSVTGAVVRRLGGLGDFSAVSIRGSSFRQVQVFLDGIPLNLSGSEAVNLGDFPLSMLERVEVYRGNAPSEFGAAPIGGVVNLVTKRGANRQALGMEYGGFSTSRVSFSHQDSDDFEQWQTSSLLSAEAFHTQGDFSYFSDNGTLYNLMDDSIRVRVNNDTSQFSGLSRLVAANEDIQITLLDSVLLREEGLPGPGNSPAKDARLLTKRNLATLLAEGSLGALGLQARVWRQDRVEELDDRTGEVGLGFQWNRDAYATTGLRVHSSWIPLDVMAASSTLSLEHESFEREDLLGDTAYDPLDRQALSWSLGGHVWGDSIPMTVSPVVQINAIDSRRLAEAGESMESMDQEEPDVLWAVNPRLGLLWTPELFGGISWRANAGRYIRPPAMDELFGDQGAAHGNSELVAEEGIQWDVGVRWSRKLSSWALGVDGVFFSSHAKNKIVRIQNSQRTTVPINLGEARIRGVELALSASLAGLVESQTHLTWMDSENLTPRTDAIGNRLPSLPLWDFHQSTSLVWGERLRLGHSLSITAGNYWDVSNVHLSPARSIHSGFVRLKQNSFSLEGSLLNATDQRVAVMDRNPFSEEDDAPSLHPITDFIGYPLPGRTWLLSLRWEPPV